MAIMTINHPQTIEMQHELGWNTSEMNLILYMYTQDKNIIERHPYHRTLMPMQSNTSWQASKIRVKLAPSAFKDHQLLHLGEQRNYAPRSRNDRKQSPKTPNWRFKIADVYVLPPFQAWHCEPASCDTKVNELSLQLLLWLKYRMGADAKGPRPWHICYNMRPSSHSYRLENWEV